MHHSDNTSYFIDDIIRFVTGGGGGSNLLSAGAGAACGAIPIVGPMLTGVCRRLAEGITGGGGAGGGGAGNDRVENSPPVVPPVAGAALDVVRHIVNEYGARVPVRNVTIPKQGFLPPGPTSSYRLSQDM